MNKSIQLSRVAYKSVKYLALIFISTIIIITFLRGMDGYERALFHDMIYGNAYKPFVLRVLVPLIARLITSVIPHSLASKIPQEIDFLLTTDNQYLVEYCITIVIFSASIIGFFASIKYLYHSIFEHTPQSELIADSIGIISLICLPPFFKYVSYIYDFTNIFLYTLALGLMINKRWRSYIILYSIACLNKETTILLTVIFAWYFWDQWQDIPKNTYRNLLIAQIVLYFGINQMIKYMFRDNLGASIELHIHDHNLFLLTKPYPLTTVFVGIAIVVLTFYHWKDKPRFLKIASAMIIPLLGLTSLFGYLDELRDYYEVYPVFILLFAHSIGHILELPIAPIKLVDGGLIDYPAAAD